MSCPIVLIDDEKAFLSGFEFIVKKMKVPVVSFPEASSAFEYIRDHDVAGVFVDIVMPGLEGDVFLEKVKSIKPELIVVMITAMPDPGLIVKCMKLGAYDYLVKPVEKKVLSSMVSRVVELFQLRQETLRLRRSLDSSGSYDEDVFSQILTTSKQMKQLFIYTQNIAQSIYPILIRGETGVGKELFARAIYQLCGCMGELVSENVASLDPTLFNSTLFGHVKGAFTGADENRKGLIEQASDGVLFLDEIGDLSLENQTKLLRVLQEGEFTPVGSDKKSKLSCRFIFATHHDMEKLTDEGSFRKDLFYRIQAHQLTIPPLRDRIGDVPLLAHSFIEKFQKDFQIEKLQVAPELDSLLKSYSWPGNIRQLQAACLDAVSQSRNGHLVFDAFHRVIYGSASTQSIGNTETVPFADEIPTLKEAEIALIQKALLKTNNNQTQAAKILDLNRDTLNKRIKKLGITLE